MSDSSGLAAWDAVDDADTEGFRSYLDAVTGDEQMQALKRRSYRLLDPPPDGRLLDVGCGTGEDVRALAEYVGPGGRVVGVDASAELLATARERAAASDEAGVTAFGIGDATRLPVPDDAVDGARADRVLQHLPDPVGALRELCRVTRPGGRVAVTDSDWGTLTLAAGDDAVDDRLVDPDWACADTGKLGRRLRGWAVDAGLDDVAVEPATLSFTDLGAADAVLGVTDRVERLTAAGEVSSETADAWLAALQDADAEGRLFSSLTLFTVVGTVPGAADG